jgi:hypothetical protein
MGDWISVYCRRPVRVEAGFLRRALDGADLWTSAEALRLPEDQDERVDALLEYLRIEESPVGIDVHWWPDRRPIQVGAGARDASIGELPVPVRAHVAECVQVVDLELSLDPVGDLNETVAEVLAFAIAAAGDGVAWFYDTELLDADRVTLWVAPT